MKKRLKVVGLDCPVCAGELEGLLQQIEGVQSVSVVFVQERVTVEVDNAETLQKVIAMVNGFENAHVVTEADSVAETKKAHLWAWVRIVISAIFFAAAIVLQTLQSGQLTDILAYCSYGLAYLAVAYPVLIATVKNIAKGKIFDENFLMSVASIGAAALGEFAESVAVMLLYQFGELLQGIAVGASKRSLTKLMQLKSETATKLCGEEQRIVSPEELSIGDIVLVKKGDRVACDGVLLDGNAVVDTKALTGEAMYKTIAKGEELLAGYVNAGEAFQMRVTRDYENSAVQKILDLVENSMEHKAAPEKMITKFAKVYTPIVCLLAVLVAIFPPMITGIVQTGGLAFMDAQRWITSALTFLVISCPCALVISVPLTYFAGIGACAKAGILVKGATHLDSAAAVATVAFDKTGTLTQGNFGILKVFPVGIEEQDLLAVAAALEQYSTHPIAGAFSKIAVQERAEDVKEYIGRGLCGTYQGQEALIGTYTFACERGIEAEERISTDTVLYIALGGMLIGMLEIGDAAREDCRAALEELKEMGIRSVMLTGDTPARAQNLANAVGMDAFKAGLLPNEKVEAAQILKEDGLLMYVGDGINDAPVMAESDCAVSMGSLGSAAAIEASDFVLLSDKLQALPKLIQTAKKTKSIVWQNIVFSIVMKVLFMVLGVVGVLPLWAAVFADVGVMILAVCNSLRV